MGIAKALAAKNGYELDSNQEVMLLKKRKRKWKCCVPVFGA